MPSNADLSSFEALKVKKEVPQSFRSDSIEWAAPEEYGLYDKIEYSFLFTLAQIRQFPHGLIPSTILFSIRQFQTLLTQPFYT